MQTTTDNSPLKASEVGNWNSEVDVIVVGFGGAGACAAIEAHDAGANVVLYELASAAGGSTALSSAEIYLGGDGGTRVQQACGWQDSNEAMFAYLMPVPGRRLMPPKSKPMWKAVWRTLTGW